MLALTLCLRRSEVLFLFHLLIQFSLEKLLQGNQSFHTALIGGVDAGIKINHPIVVSCLGQAVEKGILGLDRDLC